MLRSSSWLNDTPLCRTAVNSLTGIAISPNEMVPLQIDLAIGDRRYRFGLAANPTCRRCCAPRPGDRVRRSRAGRRSLYATTCESEVCGARGDRETDRRSRRRRCRQDRHVRTRRCDVRDRPEQEERRGVPQVTGALRHRSSAQLRRSSRSTRRKATPSTNRSEAKRDFDILQLRESAGPTRSPCRPWAHPALGGRAVQTGGRPLTGRPSGAVASCRRPPSGVIRGASERRSRRAIRARPRVV